MHETMIELKLDEEMKPLKEICGKLETAIKSEFEKGIECVDAEEMGEVVDMLKDMYEAKEKIAKACYYKKIVEAMEKSEEEDKEEEKYMLRKFKEEANGDEEEARRYYDSWRHEDGRFARKGTGSYHPMSRSRRGYEEPPYWHMNPEMYETDPEYYRDVDRHLGKMYYTPMRAENMRTSDMSGTSHISGNRDGQSESRFDRARRGYEETKALHNSNTPEDKQLTMREMEKVLSVVFDELDEMLEDATPEVKAMVKQKGLGRFQKIQ